MSQKHEHEHEHKHGHENKLVRADLLGQTVRKIWPTAMHERFP